jgi:PAS domain S-box-containing protein
MLLWPLATITLGAAIAIVALARLRAQSRAAADRWATTAQVSVKLAEARDAREALGAVLRLLVPKFADWCAVHLADGDQVRRIAVHTDPAIDQTLNMELARLTFDVEAPRGPARVMRTGTPELVHRVTGELLQGEKPETRDLLGSMGFGSVVVVPLKARTQTVGALTLARRDPERYDERDLAWAEDLGHRIGLAVENARLYAEARELFEQTVSANFVSTPDGRILACNQTFASLLGLGSVEEARVASAMSFYVQPEERAQFLVDLQARGRLSNFESTIRRRDGNLVAVAESAIGTFNERGELTKITGFIVDRSAEKRLEEQLRQAQRLEAVGQLAGGIAHDFNNLLTVIIGCADLMRIERREPPPATQHDPLEELSKAARRAATLTHQLLAFSRRQVLQPREVDLNEALRNVHSMLRRLVRENVVLVMELDPRIDRIRVDPGQLDQVVINLVVNSGDAMPTGGTVTISTANVVLGDADVAQYPYVRPGAYVSLVVRDTGIGMDEATCARVFEPFFTTKPVGKGTGLGLSTVYGIVKQSGGYIWVTSAQNAGTIVSVCLPAAEAA